MYSANINRTLSIIFSFILTFFLSCSKDSDLFDEYVIVDKEVPPIEENNDNDDEVTNPGDDGENQEPNDNPDIPNVPDLSFEDKPNTIVGTFHPKSAEELSNPEFANHKAIIDSNIECDNCRFAENLTIETAGGIIIGERINLNGAYIINTFKPIFTPTTTFTNVYNKSRLSPETFGADGNDSVADDEALVTLIMQSEYAIGQEGAVYIKNKESVIHMRSGVFDWNMNNSIVRTTSAASLSHDNTDNSSKKYLFEIRDLDVRITNGEFDGQNAASRCFFLRDVASIDFQNVTVRNFFAPPGAKARGMAFLVEVSDNYKGGQWVNCVISNIGAASDGVANNVPYGFAKGIYFTVGTEKVAETKIQGCKFENIYGDDAEAFSNTHKYGYNRTYQHATSGLSFIIDNNIFRGCQRRALKINLSNCQITNNLVESATNSPSFKGAQASLIQTFPLHDGQTMKNVNLIGNTIRVLGDSQNAAFGINDAKECLIENNIFESSYTDLNRFITFGVTSTQDGLYEGDLDNTVVFKNNTATNLMIRLASVYEAINGGFVFEDNILNMNVDRHLNAWWGVIRLLNSSGDSEPYTFKNITININQTDNAGGLFGGAFLSLGGNMKNLTFDNVKVNYTGSTVPSSAFARIGTPGFNGNFDSTNLINNSSISGVVGTGAVDVTGSDTGAIIRNSVGDGSTPITIK